MNKTQFLIIPQQIDIDKLILLAAEPCERFTGRSVCSDDSSLSFDAEYTADRYCSSCRVRSAVGHVPLKV